MTQSKLNVLRERLEIWGILLGVAIFLFATGFRYPLAHKDMDMSIVIPIPLQILASGGDRFLAANVGVWRVLMTGGQILPQESLRALARIHEDVSLLNPGHEDNYVTATALLPWEGFVNQTQIVLDRATWARTSDIYAPFFFGFNQIHFRGDAAGAFKYGQLAAARAESEAEKQALTFISAAWLERGSEPAVAERVIAMLAAELSDEQLKENLMLRAKRQKIMSEIQVAADEYYKQYGHHVASLEELVIGGFVDLIPRDPLRSVRFTIDSNGRVRIVKIEISGGTE